MKPVLGRLFTPKDDSPGSPPTILLAYEFWQRKFGGSNSALGKRILIDGKAAEVIGVLPRNFRFLDQKPAVFLPFQFDRAKTYLGNFSFQAVARLKPGATIEEANADVARMLPLMMEKFPPPPGITLKMFQEARLGPHVRPFQKDLVGDLGNVLWLLMGTIGMVLLIACANVANLLLVRAEGRQQELAIRAALGAGSGRIAGELLYESLTLGLMGGALGVGFAYAGLRGLVALAPADLPRLDAISIDARGLLFTLGVSVLAGLLFGMIPVWKYARAHLGTALRAGGRSLSESRERHRARSLLVVVQVMLALVLLISSGLMIRTFQAMKQVSPGFTRPGELLTLQLAIPEDAVKEPPRVVRMDTEILRRLGEIAGVSAAAAVSSVPMGESHHNDPIFVADRTYSDSQIPPLRRFKFISPGYFHTLGNPILAGRDLTWTDIENRLPVVLVSENLAREYWHDPAAAIGKRIRENLNDDWREIIGVVGNERDDGPNEKAPAIVYWPFVMNQFWDQKPMVHRSLTFVVRSGRTGSSGFLQEVQQAVWSVDGNLPLAQVRTLEEVYRKSMARTSFTLVMLAIAGAMALVLGLVGIYGVIAYSVTQRSREIGIRLALGAKQEAVTGMFVRHGLMLTGIGLVAGLAAATGLMRLMSSLLFEVSPVDPMTYAVVSASLLTAAVLASYLPARRATAVDPVETLRAE